MLREPLVGSARRWLLARGLQQADIMDIMQEAASSLLGNHQQPSEALWLTAIKRRYVDSIRRSKRAKKLQEKLVLQRVVTTASVPTDRIDLARLLERARIPAKSRHDLALFVHGKAVAEIARENNERPSTTRSRFDRTKRCLHELAGQSSE